MAGSLNKVMLIGNLGKDPEIRTMNSGDRLATLRIATSESWKDRNSGERKERTEWHQVVIFNEHLVKVAEDYLRKGSTVYIEGALQTRKYEQNGVEKYATEIVLQKFNGTLTMIGGKRDGGDAGERYAGHQREGYGSGGYGQNATGRSEGQREAFAADEDDEIPF